ncbi:MAG: hypothetical protein MHM6MM_004985 [Cercozoa sp. M6MM]
MRRASRQLANLHRDFLRLQRNDNALLADNLVARLRSHYSALHDDDEKAQVIRNVATRMHGINATAVADILSTGTLDDIEVQQRIRQSLHCSYEQVWLRLLHLPGGLDFLVDFRADVLKMKRSDPAVDVLLQRLTRLVSTLFSASLLQLRDVDDAELDDALLTFLDKHERVHQTCLSNCTYSDAADKRAQWLQRIAPVDRRVFALTHSALCRDKPLVFTQVALQSHVPTSIDRVLKRRHAHDTDTDIDITDTESDTNIDIEHTHSVAAFYSISSTRSGLSSGVDLGQALLKQAMRQLQTEGVGTFVTLSPLPTFVKWLRNHGHVPQLLDLLDKQEYTQLCSLLRTDYKEQVKELSVEYLTKAKRGSRCFDPVANFHVGNGASILQVNSNADMSHKGLQQSLGMMVNYHYVPENTPDNAHNYRHKGLVVSAL